MKLVIALIRPEQLPDVKRALFAAQIRHLTATMTLGTAPKSEQQKFRGVEREVSLFQRVRVEVAVTDAMVEAAVGAIRQGALDSGGWGRIFVLQLADAVTIWTGQRGPETL